MAKTYFTPATFDYLKQLAKNNKKEWFDKNRSRYEEEVRQPALAFIEAAAPGLAKISKEIVADPRPQGGSLMRVFRDIRFSKDKSPYKTNVGIGFGHRGGKFATAPGFYLHIVPGDSFSGGGVHMADTASLNKIRDAIVKDTAGWKKATQSPKFKASQDFDTEMLKKAPQGYDPTHPMIDDLRRKGFFAHARYAEKQVASADFLDRFLENARTEAPLMAFLSRALGVPW